MPYETIKGVEKLTGLSESALRYYEKKGIVMPTLHKEHGRKEWLYDEEAISRLNVVKLLKHIDMAIEDIGRVVNDEKADRAELIDDQLTDLKERRERLDRQIIVAEFLRYVEEEAADRHIEDTEMIDVIDAAAKRLINNIRTG